ncbi:hypothetical protein BC629DRAFT_1515632 [Irpex lacteus]|nr:hypothetical protein BC629DRAFT_1515632 [Irpex lacteus]
MSGKSINIEGGTNPHASPRRAVARARRTPVLLLTLCAAVATLTVYACNFYLVSSSRDAPARLQHVPFNAQQLLTSDFHARAQSDRFEEGTRPTLIKNAISGRTVVETCCFLEGRERHWIRSELRARCLTDLVTIEADGAWVTPGWICKLRLRAIVDLHSHVGLLSAPRLKAHSTIDAFNTHDDAFELAIAGGVTSAQVLPGSGNAIGTHSYVYSASLRREPKKYGTRMDSLWAFRSAYDEARKIKKQQETFEFPESLKWEMLVDISNHSNERVRVPIASFHHAMEAWLVPDMGWTPAISLFATSDHLSLTAATDARSAASAPFRLVYQHPLAPRPRHRIGLLREGSDADVVLWDSHPLTSAQHPSSLDRRYPPTHPATPPKHPFSPNPESTEYDRERKEAWDAEVYLTRTRKVNVASVWIREEVAYENGGPRSPASTRHRCVHNGAIACVGEEGWCLQSEGEFGPGNKGPEDEEIDLRGSVGPGLMTFGSAMGVEGSSRKLVDAFRGEAPSILNDVGG